jgi:hypothetical protein
MLEVSQISGMPSLKHLPKNGVEAPGAESEIARARGTISTYAAAPGIAIATPVQPHPMGHEAIGVQMCISLLGEMRIWLEKDGVPVEVPVKSHRRLELLAYIATVAPERSKRVSSGRILTDVFEHIAPRADVDNLRNLFQKHVQLLRKEVNEIADQAGFPKLKLFQYEKVDNSSTKWWLSEECRVVDLPIVRFLHEQVEAAREQGAAAGTELETASDQLIRFYQAFQGDYLERHLLTEEFGDAEWAQVPFTEYREMYLQALWEAAVLAHNNSMQLNLSDQQRYKYAKRAALLYKTYALHSPRYRDLDLNAKKSRRQSERALRGYLRMCRWLMDAQGADEAYSAYESLMAQEFPEWKPNVTTVEILRFIRQHTGENPLLRDQLEPPEG